ncbi:MAG TPA: potassium-transporting ATPase subunit KdpC, partial [Candidatus Dormibacteraeota bacterium]|nr:potassium-transporting ATPase subunit KdpC [Candidatus Dormibacteraeota bacterium]
MLKSIPKELLISLRLTIVLAALTGLIYPFVVTGIAQALFSNQANGSLVIQNGQVIGSTLIGQQFTDPKYFHGRISSTVDPASLAAKPYAAENSAGSNYGPSNQALHDRVASDVRRIQQEDGSTAPVPVDLVTSDFSGLDPNISEAGALYQVNRVATARGLDPVKVRALVEKDLQGRILWVFGEPHLNVLQLNLD